MITRILYDGEKVTPIPCWNGYYITTFGRVISGKRKFNYTTYDGTKTTITKFRVLSQFEVRGYKRVSLYNDKQRRRHEVRPGLSGYAQVNGRNAISWEERFDLDVEYVDNISFALDCKIIFKTIKAVLAREGISSETAVTMEKFKGSDD